MILVWLFVLPFIGGFLSWQIERAGLGWPRWIALATMFVVLGLTAHLWLTGDYSLTLLGDRHQWVQEFQVPWIPRFGISFHLALDGLSLILVALTSLLGIMAIACSWREVQRNVGFFHLNLLWNLGGVIGVFLAMDLFLFFFFWEMMLVPMYFLIALWGHNAPGGKGRVYAATKFFIYTQASGLLMLLAILALVFVHYTASGVITFDYPKLLHTPMNAQVEWWLMLGFFVAFAVKLPVVPLHNWLPDAHSQAPTAGSVDLAGILLKTAAYGMLRFALPLFPHASAQFAPIAMWLGVFGIVYGAVLAFGQNDVKRLVAYTSISHMGFVLIGIYAGTEQALQGAVINMLAHGISAGALFILCGEVYERLHTRDLRLMGGLWARFPFLPPIALFFAAASLGLPGLANFVGEFLVLLGTFPVNKWVTAVAATGLILAAVYSLMFIQRAFYGPVHAEEKEKLADLNPREIATMFSLMALLVLFGLYPQPVLDLSKAPMQAVQRIYQAAQATVAHAGEGTPAGGRAMNFTMDMHQWLALAPILIVSATIMWVMVAIAFRRHHWWNATVVAVGLNAALVSATYLVLPLLIDQLPESLGTPLLNIIKLFPSAPIPQFITPLLVVDSYACFYMGLVLAAGLATATLTFAYMEGYKGNKEEVYILLALSALGGLVVVCSRHFAAFFIGLELLSLPLYGMIGYLVKERRSLEASLKYLVLSAVASAFILFGMALIFAVTGTLSFDLIGRAAHTVHGSELMVMIVGGALLLVGVAFKLSLAPFHLWTPDVYEGAPAPVAAYLATASKTAVIALLLRYFVETHAYQSIGLMNVLTALAILSIVLGNILALLQDNIKRLLAYSSIAHFGYILVAFIAAGALATEAVGMYLLTYVVTTLAAFGVVTLVSSPYGEHDADTLWDYRGLFWRRPNLAAILTVALLSLAGIPLTAGFIGKFYVLAAGVDKRLWLLLAAVVFGSAVGLFYYLRAMAQLYLRAPWVRKFSAPLDWAQNTGGLMLLTLALLMLLLGVYPTPFIAVVRAAGLAGQ